MGLVIFKNGIYKAKTYTYFKQYIMERNIYKIGKELFITSNEEIKEDYVIAHGVAIKVMMFDEKTLYFVNGTKAKKRNHH